MLRKFEQLYILTVQTVQILLQFVVDSVQNKSTTLVAF